MKSSVLVHSPASAGILPCGLNLQETGSLGSKLQKTPLPFALPFLTLSWSFGRSENLLEANVLPFPPQHVEDPVYEAFAALTMKHDP